MDKFKIVYIKDKDLENAINKVDDIWSVYGSISITVNIIKDPYLESLGLFISYFFSTCLSLIPNPHVGKHGKFELEGPFELIFEPEDSKIAINLNENGKLKGERLYVSQKDFAKELIEATQEYIDYIIELRPDLKVHKSTQELREKLKVARVWHFQKHNEKI